MQKYQNLIMGSIILFMISMLLYINNNDYKIIEAIILISLMVIQMLSKFVPILFVELLIIYKYGLFDGLIFSLIAYILGLVLVLINKNKLKKYEDNKYDNRFNIFLDSLIKDNLSFALSYCDDSLIKKIFMGVTTFLPNLIYVSLIIYLFKKGEYIIMVTTIVGMVLISYIGLNYLESIKGE